MLYIFLFICVCGIIYGLRFDEDVLAGLSFCFALVVAIVLLVTIGCYNDTKSTASSRMEVLIEQNETVLSQIEPLVQQALNYESDTYKEFKLTPENIIAFGNMYPQLQANSFIQSQINIIVENQNEIKNLKLEIASLNAYHLWLFTGKE
jgi:hypothetical protein